MKEINAITQIKEEILKVPTFQSDIPQWDFTDIVCEMLYQFADMVSSVSVVPEVEILTPIASSEKKFLRLLMTLMFH